MIEVKNMLTEQEKEHMCVLALSTGTEARITSCSFYHLLPRQNKWTGLRFSGFKPCNWKDTDIFYKGYKYVIIQKKRKVLEN